MLDYRSFIFGFLLCLALAGLGAVALGLGYGPATPTYRNTALTILAGDANTSVQPLFSPGSGSEIVSLMNGAQHTMDIEMYEMTDSSGLGAVMAAARARGVTVRLILEPRVNSKAIPAMVAGLSASGVQVKWASLQYTLTHSKMMIIDGHVVLVGSINFSKAAQNTNREADAVLDGPVAAEYEKVFETDWAAASDARPDTPAYSAGG